LAKGTRKALGKSRISTWAKVVNIGDNGIGKRLLQTIGGLAQSFKMKGPKRSEGKGSEGKFLLLGADSSLQGNYRRKFR